jgi:hypothetical protein
MATTVLVENRAGSAVEVFERLAPLLASQRSIKIALDWLLAQRPPLTPSEIVAQDEYSHDVLVAYPGGLYLVYDST